MVEQEAKDLCDRNGWTPSYIAVPFAGASYWLIKDEEGKELARHELLPSAVNQAYNSKQTTIPEGLLPCPFCGAGEYRYQEQRTPPRMDGKESSIVCVSLRHWCENQPGLQMLLSRNTKELLVETWNHRNKLTT